MELIILAGMCGLIGLGCLGGAAWAVLGAEDVGVERIFLVIVWLFFAALFLGMAAFAARMGPLKNLGKKSPSPPEEKPAGAATAAS